MLKDIGGKYRKRGSDRKWGCRIQNNREGEGDYQEEIKNMRSLLMLCFIIGLFLMTPGCQLKRVRYDIQLEKVQKSIKIVSKYGIGSWEGLTFKDGLCDITFSIKEDGIGIELLNKIEETIKVVWDEAAYVDISGVSQRITHLGVKFIHSDRPQPVTAIPASTKLNDLIVPARHATWTESGWEIIPLYPEVYSFVKPPPQTRKVISEFNNKTIGILLPLKIGSYVNEYFFIFRIRAWIE